jgi:hypothetical protein
MTTEHTAEEMGFSPFFPNPLHGLIGRLVGHHDFLKYEGPNIRVRTSWARLDREFADGYWATNIHTGEEVYLPAHPDIIHTVMPKTY